MTKKDSVPVRALSASYKELSAAASELNTASDELGRSISVLDAALKKLNLGIPTWVNIQEWHDQSGEYYTIDKLGYAKVGGKWGIALRTADGSYNYPDDEKSEEWLFNEAPRSLRISAIDKIPDLLERLIKEAQAMIKKVRDKGARARELAEAISQATSDKDIESLL